MNDLRVIHVKGKGAASAEPDFVKITMEIDVKNMEYAESVNESKRKIDVLRKAASEVGFTADDIKTTFFDVDTEHEHEEYEMKGRTHYRNVFTGYLSRHHLELGFCMDSERLDRVVSALQHCEVRPELRISFSVKDKEKIFARVLESATRDAQRKAEVLCQASGVKLGELLRIEYPLEKTDVFPSVTAHVLCQCLDESSPSFDFRPKDIEVEEIVDFFWEFS